MQFKTVLQSINPLNILLISAVAAFASYSLFPFLNMEVKYALPVAKKSTAQVEEPPVGIQVPSLTEYAKVSEENLFHPGRKIPVEKKEEAPLPKPEFVLYGTLVSDELSLAYLEDLKAPRSSPGKGKRQTPLKKGDSMSGFTLKEIETDKVVMLRGTEKMIVAVNDPSHPKARTIETAIAQVEASRPKPPGIQPAARQAHTSVIQPTRPAARRQRQTTMPSVRTSPSNERRGVADIPRQ